MTDTEFRADGGYDSGSTQRVTTQIIEKMTATGHCIEAENPCPDASNGFAESVQRFVPGKGRDDPQALSARWRQASPVGLAVGQLRPHR